MSHYPIALSYPLLGVFIPSFISFWTAARFGVWLRVHRSLSAEEHEQFSFVLTAGLTLLVLLIGFAFSMASTRYDLRKNYEEKEANAIGTEYVRADLLPAQSAARLKAMLKQYTGMRIGFYRTRSGSELDRINTETAKLQSEMWHAVQEAAHAEPTPAIALVVAGMNDVLNRQGYTQAIFWNRLPESAWALMILIAICCNALVGYSGRKMDGTPRVIFMLPLFVALALFFIADIDSPRRGLIHVVPRNLISLLPSLK